MIRASFNSLALVLAALLAFGCASGPAGPADAGWITLFDGATGLQHWNRVGDGNWRVVDGVIAVDRKTDKTSSYLMTKNAYADFQLRVEFWISEDGNSGIYMRCSDLNKILDTTCYEAQISDRSRDPAFGSGAIMNFLKLSPPAPKVGGQWNTFEITAKGSHLTVVLNGVRTVEGDDNRFASGPIGLQYAVGTVKFRKVQLRPL
jgi:hypothetical protein